jgi:RND family efflux transporter MFP subunit
MLFWLKALILAAATLAVAACEKEPEAKPEVVRAIKHLTIQKERTLQQRRISGVIKAAESSGLSFEIGGTVQTVNFDLGDQVSAGDLLVELDVQPFQLRVQAAQGELSQAKAVLRERTSYFEAQKKLYRDGWIAKTRFDRVVSTYESAQSVVETARANLDIVSRDLRKARIVAPFGGRVATKSVDPFVEVTPGQVLLTLETEGALEVDIPMPETLIDIIDLADEVQVEVPAAALTLPAMVTEIGSRAQAANSFPVTLAFLQEDSALRPGMTADAIFTFDRHSGEPAFLVPLSALLSEAGDRVSIFVYDKESSTVRNAPVAIRDMVENLIEITEGLEDGDIIATAGVEYLEDGRKVTLLDAPLGAE